jgi:predicted nucleic acid-binding protein
MNGGTIDFIADTSAIIGLLRRDPQIEQKVIGKAFAITFVTLAELSLGVLKSTKPDAAWSRIQDVLHDLRMFHVSTLTPAIYARVYFNLEERGKMIPINDI